MARRCGILGISLREDDPGTYKLKLTEEDIAGHKNAKGEVIQPGLYSCSYDAWEKFGPACMERGKREQMIDHNGALVFNPDGSPRMRIPADATFATVDQRMLW